LDRCGYGGAYGYSIHISPTLVSSEQAKPPSENPKETHRVQCLLVLPPLICHCLCLVYSTWILPLPLQEMVQKNSKHLKFQFQLGLGQKYLCCGLFSLPKILFPNLVCATLPQTWMYLAVPIILYACERLIRAFRSGYKTVRILQVHFNFIYILFSYDVQIHHCDN
jgi:hypothetical protein